MSDIKFILKEPNSKQETIIFLIYRNNYKRLKYSTGENIKPEFWNFKTQRTIENITGDSILKEKNKSINTQLNRYYNKLTEILTDFKKQNITPGIDLIKKELDREFKKNTPNEKLNFLNSILEFIKTTNKKVRTKQSYESTYNHLLKYIEFRNIKNFNFENINLDFYDDFVRYLNENLFSVNTIGKHIKNIKVFMNDSKEKKLHTNTEYLSKRFKTVEEETESIYLTEEELNRLYNLDLSNNKRLEKVRDLFIIGCRTGLRFSDLTQITPENIIYNGQIIKIKTIKTDELVNIPLHWTAKEILIKYNYDLPRTISNQKMNDYLKELGKLAEINETFNTSITKGGFRIDKNYKKHELITVHTARRSFATNMYLQDIPSISIMKITGHRTEKSFLRYIKISQEDNAKKLLLHPYFTKQANFKVVI